MGSANHISLLAAKRGYWQIPVAEEQWKTAFVAHDVLYEWTRFEKRRATFVRATETILRPVRAFVLLLLRMLMTCLLVLVNGHSICVMSGSICR